MVDPKQIITTLANRYPNCFSSEVWRPHRPLALGIREAIVADGIELNEGELGRVLGFYCRRVMYLRALIAGAPRVDLQGMAAGFVSTEHAEHARKSLEELLERRTQRTEEAQVARRISMSTEGKNPPVEPPAESRDTQRELSIVDKEDNGCAVSARPASLSDLRSAALARRAAEQKTGAHLGARHVR
jgi:ProP effector